MGSGFAASCSSGPGSSLCVFFGLCWHLSSLICSMQVNKAMVLSFFQRCIAPGGAERRSLAFHIQSPVRTTGTSAGPASFDDLPTSASPVISDIESFRGALPLIPRQQPAWSLQETT